MNSGATSSAGRAKRIGEALMGGGCLDVMGAMTVALSTAVKPNDSCAKLELLTRIKPWTACL